MDLLDPKNDLVFKMMLTQRKELLLDMLTGILARPIEDLTVTNPTIPGELPADKQIILDIHAVLADASRADLEMQMQSPLDLLERLLFYTTRNYSRQLRRGDQYHLLTPTTTIVWLAKPLFTEITDLHSIFELRDRATSTRFSDHVSIHFLQLSNLGACPADSDDYTATVHRWARFLTARTHADFEQLASEHPIMYLAKETLEQLSIDPETYRLAQEREDSIKLYEMSLYASRVKGQEEGKREALLSLLGLRFGPLTDAVRSHVESATPKHVETWTERVLTADSLDELFAP